MSGHDFKIRPADVHDTPGPFRMESGRAFWEAAAYALGDGADPERSGHLELDGESYRIGQRLLFRGRLRGGLALICAGCLEPFELELDEAFELLLEPAGPNAGLGESGVELDPEDLSVGRYAGDELDFAPVILEIVALAWPMRARCSEGCRGLCPVCGSNRNSDPCRCEPTSANRPFAGLDRLLASRGDRGEQS